MNWQQPIDIYCERVGAEFWAEPLNALSNIAFLIAAFFAWRIWRGKAIVWPETKLLTALLALIGLGSFLFHTVAVQWSLFADILPIAVFQLIAVWAFTLRALEQPRWMAFLAAAVFLVVSQTISVVVPEAFLNGSAAYLPSLLTLWFFALLLRHKKPETAKFVACAGVVFLVSLTFRSVDMAVCQVLPIGVHYMWHFLNATMLYLVILSLQKNDIHLQSSEG